MANTNPYSETELLACAAARLLEDGRAVLVGTGLPMIATLLAQRTHAPQLLIIFEAGGVGSRVPTLPISVGDSRTFHRALMASSMHDVMSACQAGHVDYGFLGAAAIDGYGNVNTTVFGEWEHPQVRLPGSGGANDVGSFCWRLIYIMRNHNPRTFVARLPFITTAGWIDGPTARQDAGLPSGGGPFRVISQLGVLGFDDDSKRMTLLAVHPSVTPEQVQAATGFPLLMAKKVEVTEPPTPEELRALQDIDPTGVVIRRA
jgi:glutaconate CoA-transferase subunit B